MAMENRHVAAGSIGFAGDAEGGSAAASLVDQMGDENSDHELAAAAHPELFVEAAEVGVNGTCGDAQFPADGRLVQAVEYAADDLQLACGEWERRGDGIPLGPRKTRRRS